MSTDAQISCRPACEEDLEGMAGVYMAAFPESMAHLFGSRPPAVAAVAEVLRLPMLSEPLCATVAEHDGAIAGYCLAPAHVSHLRTVALHNTWNYLGRWLAGHYRVGLRPLRIMLLDKLAQFRQRRHDAFHVEAHILSVAVHPDYQGRGLGRRLVQAGVDYLAGEHVPAVRLEVRPGNPGAIHLYESLGFRAVGETADSQGAWLIMIKDMPRDE